jgi:hypothetical protein
MVQTFHFKNSSYAKEFSQKTPGRYIFLIHEIINFFIHQLHQMLHHLPDPDHPNLGIMIHRP